MECRIISLVTRQSSFVNRQYHVVENCGGDRGGAGGGVGMLAAYGAMADYVGGDRAGVGVARGDWPGGPTSPPVSLAGADRGDRDGDWRFVEDSSC